MYDNLADLLTFERNPPVAKVDNDCVVFYRETNEGEEIYEQHPNILIIELLRSLGIKAEWV